MANMKNCISLTFDIFIIKWSEVSFISCSLACWQRHTCTLHTLCFFCLCVAVFSIAVLFPRCITWCREVYVSDIALLAQITKLLWKSSTFKMTLLLTSVCHWWIFNESLYLMLLICHSGCNRYCENFYIYACFIIKTDRVGGTRVGGEQ